jgi:hypothetical protein
MCVYICMYVYMYECTFAYIELNLCPAWSDAYMCTKSPQLGLCVYSCTADGKITWTGATVSNWFWYWFTTRKSLKAVEKVSIILESFVHIRECYEYRAVSAEECLFRKVNSYIHTHVDYYMIEYTYDMIENVKTWWTCVLELSVHQMQLTKAYIRAFLSMCMYECSCMRKLNWSCS